MHPAACVLTVSALGLGYIYLGYPLLAWLLAKVCPRPVRKSRDNLPECTVLITACNEAGTLPAKLRSVLASTRADRIVEIVVVDDGSTDGTAAAVEALGEPRLRVVRQETRSGKPAAFNAVIPTCRAPVVVLSDARQPWSPDALEKLLSNFADPSVGVVSGELEFRAEATGTTAARGIDAYWRYEKFIRRHEALWGSVPGATGALNAIRRDLFRPIHPDTVLDDVAVPMSIIQQGRRCVFEPGAIAYDNPHADAGRESVRKRRTIGGNLQLVMHTPSLLLPWRNPAWFQFVSHKLLRLLSPFLLVAVFASAFVLRPVSGWPSWAWPLCLLYLALVAVGALAQRLGLRSRLLGIPYMFWNLNVATALAWLDALSGRLKSTWDRSDKG